MTEDNTSPRTDARQLEPLLEAGYQLIPLHTYDHVDGRGRSRGKSPLDFRGWTTNDYDSLAQVSHMESGKNVGVRLTESDVILDVDPKNFEEGDNPLERFKRDTGLRLGLYPTVVTGSGGLHVYMKKPDNVSIRDSLAEYRGLEFKSKGRQMVAPGSIHPGTLRTYEWDEFGPSLVDGVPDAPMGLLDIIERRPVTPVDAAPDSGARLTPEQLGEVLEGLDPCDFRDQGDWFELMTGCHHATHGMGLDEFLDWSTRDPDYSDDANRIAPRWDSLRHDVAGGVTFRTLFYRLENAGAGGLIPPNAVHDFHGVEVDEKTLRALVEAAGDSTFEDTLPDRHATTMAAAFLDAHPDLILRHGAWMEFHPDQNRYVGLSDKEVQSRITAWTDKRGYVNERGQPVRFEASASKSRSIELAGFAHTSALGRRIDRALPAWRSRPEGAPDASRMVMTRNGNLDPETGRLMPLSRDLVSIHSSPVSYDPGAACPTWLRCLDEWFEGDEEQVRCLQEMTGLLLTGDTSYQRVFMLIGPPRSGKSTAAWVQQQLLGDGGYCAPTAESIVERFGLMALLGTSAAYFSDLRLEGSRRKFVEVVLKISGEDTVNVEIKGIAPVQERLPTRIVIVSNETPVFNDASAAISSRLVLIKTTQSFQGREDFGLKDKLERELPGIMNWALDGLASLRRRGRFVVPTSSAADLEESARQTSPAKAFLASDRFERVDPSEGAWTAKEDVVGAFTDFCLLEDLPPPRNSAHAIRDLNSAGAGLRAVRPRVLGQRVQAFADVRVRADDS